jgi:hypothetical protein
LATSCAPPRVLALTKPHVEAADPAAPRYAADEPKVAATPFGRLDDEHPLRRAFRAIAYPVSAERVLSSVRADPAVANDQAEWLEAVLPHDRIFASDAEVVEALGAWGPSPPTKPPSL